MSDDKNSTPEAVKVRVHRHKYRHEFAIFDTRLGITILLLLALAISTVFLAIILVVGFYVSMFHDQPLSPDPAVWGQFGDYLGGTLNPVLGVFTFIALAITVGLQIRQIAHSHVDAQSVRDETRNAAKIQRDTVRAMEEQARYAALTARASCLSTARNLAIEDVEALQRIVNMGNSIGPAKAEYVEARVMLEEAKKRQDRLSAEIQQLADELLATGSMLEANASASA